MSSVQLRRDDPTHTLLCDMTDTCIEPVSMIDDHGFIYCATHGIERRYWKCCRKLRPHELNRLKRGQQIARY